MTTPGSVRFDYLTSEDALFYLWQRTPEGEGVLLTRGEDGIWRSGDIPGAYAHPKDAAAAIAALLSALDYGVDIRLADMGRADNA